MMVITFCLFQVRIPACPGPELIMSLCGGSCEAVAGVLQMAIPFMYEQGRLAVKLMEYNVLI